MSRKLYNVQQEPGDMRLYSMLSRKMQMFAAQQPRIGNLVTEEYLHYFGYCKRKAETLQHTLFNGTEERSLLSKLK